MQKAALTILIGLFLLAIGCGRSSSADPPRNQAPTPVKIQLAQLVPVNDSSDYLATLKSRNSTTVSPQVDGQITHILVKSGDQVKAGVPIMQIDPLKQQASVGSQEATRAAKEANLLYSKQQLERTSQLYASGVASKQSLDEAQSAYDAAQAELKSLDAQVREQQVQLQYFRVVAPTSGIIGDIPVHVGDRVTTSTVLTTVDQPGTLEAYVEVPVERAKQLALNEPVQIMDSEGNVIARSRISFISPRVDDQAQTVLVKTVIDAKPGSLRTAQLIRARVVWDSHPGLLIPVLAVSRINGQFFVFLAEGGEKGLVAHQKQVRLGEIIGNDYVVLDGLKAGDRIVVSGTQILGEGTPVRPES